MKTILISLILLISTITYADTNTDNNTNNPDLYQVNVIIFEHITPQVLQAEQWPAITDMPNLQNALEPQLLDPDDSQLKLLNHRFSRKIAQQEHYKVLLDIAWQQEIPVTKYSEPIRITGDKIDGTITIHRDRYFNIATNLILTESAAYLDNIGPGNYADNIVDNYYKSFQMKQTRRMRSKELNYLDHPLFGMLIKIMPAE
jgi:hypothetical protein